MDQAPLKTLIEQQARVSTAFRWGALFMMSFVVLAVYFAYDSLNPIGELLKQDLNISAARFGMLKQSAASIPNIVILIFGGILLDRIGARIGGALFVSVCLLGTLVTAVGGQLESYWIMFTGRMIFGSGVETLIIAQNKIIAKWFKGKELSFAFGLNLGICRLGTFFAFTSMNGLTKAFLWQGALWVVALLMGIGVVVYAVYAFLDFRVEKRIKILDNSLGKFQLSAIILATLGVIGTFFAILLKLIDRHAKISIEVPEQK